MSHDGYLPPGCTQRECDQAQPGYWDEPEQPDEEVEPMTEVPITDQRRAHLPQRRACETFELRHGNLNATRHVTVGRYPDGTVGEVFVSGAKVGSELEANERDTAILVSLALQHGVPIGTMAAAITREGDGRPSTVIGRVLDRLRGEGLP